MLLKNITENNIPRKPNSPIILEYKHFVDAFRELIFETISFTPPYILKALGKNLFVRDDK